MSEGKKEYDPPCNADVEKDMNELPDEVADALLEWRKATIKRENWEAKTILGTRESGMATSWEQARLQVKSSDEWLLLSTIEAQNEAEYSRLYERLMSTKKTAGIRMAY